jgi:hypothetical protein
VTIRGSYPDTAADFYGGPRHFAPEQSGVFEDANLVGVFEGYDQLFLGIDGGKRAFRVFALREPSRLAVDLRDE